MSGMRVNVDEVTGFLNTPLIHSAFTVRDSNESSSSPDSNNKQMSNFGNDLAGIEKTKEERALEKGAD
jgi:hypothetical protein